MRLVVKGCFLTALMIGALVAGCSGENGSKVSGTVTDTGNTIASVSGVVTRTDGELAVAARVRMARVVAVRDSFEVPDYVEVQTDSEGVFSFDSALSDTFQLAVIDSESTEISYFPRVTADGGNLDSIRLEKAAVFSSVLYYEDLSDSLVAVGSHFQVFMPGTPFFQSVFAADSFEMLIPPGEWAFSFCPGDPQIIAKLQGIGLEDNAIYRSWKMDRKVKSGDTLYAGPFVWGPTTEIDTLIKEVKSVPRISGTVNCMSGKPCEGVEVMLITDIYGFGLSSEDSMLFVPQTKTDSDGRWWLPVPATVPYDSFRVELREMKDGKVKGAALSRYVYAKEVSKLKDTLSIGKVSVKKPSGLISRVSLVVDIEDSTQSNNCMMNSIVVGIKGTSHFVREVTCNPLKIMDLPVGSQDIVLHSGDAMVVKRLLESETPLDDYITITHVILPDEEPLVQQGMTYTPPSLK